MVLLHIPNNLYSNPIKSKSKKSLSCNLKFQSTDIEAPSVEAHLEFGLESLESSQHCHISSSPISEYPSDHSAAIRDLVETMTLDIKPRDGTSGSSCQNLGHLSDHSKEVMLKEPFRLTNLIRHESFGDVYAVEALSHHQKYEAKVYPLREISLKERRYCTRNLKRLASKPNFVGSTKLDGKMYMFFRTGAGSAPSTRSELCSEGYSDTVSSNYVFSKLSQCKLVTLHSTIVSL